MFKDGNDLHNSNFNQYTLYIRYKHNYNVVQTFDRQHNISIVLCFVLNSSLIAYIIYRIAFDFRFGELTQILVILLLLPLTIIAFIAGSDVEVMATESRLTIEEYMLSDQSSDSSFVTSCHNFNTLLLSKGLSLTLLGIKSMSYTTLSFIIFFVAVNTKKLINFYYKYIESDNNQTTINNCTS